MIVAILLVAVGLSGYRLTRAEQDAIEARGEAKVLAEQRDSAEARLDAVRVRLVALSDTVVQAQAEVERVRVDAQRRAAAASQAFEDAVAALEPSPELDQIVAAHAEEVDALQTEIDALEEERAILYRRIELGDSVVAQTVAVNRALQAELTAWRVQAVAWERAAKPGIGLKIKRQAPVAVVALAAGYLLGGI